MARSHPLVEVALDLARLSDALAETLEAGDFDAAERLVAERGRVLTTARDIPTPSLPADLALLADARNAILSADRRSAVALESGITGLHGELAELATGARAVRAYLAPDPIAPGWVDRND